MNNYSHMLSCLDWVELIYLLKIPIAWPVNVSRRRPIIRAFEKPLIIIGSPIPGSEREVNYPVRRPRGRTIPFQVFLSQGEFNFISAHRYTKGLNNSEILEGAQSKLPNFGVFGYGCSQDNI